MRKFILMTVLAMSTILSANAQEAVSGVKFSDNWYVGVGGGAATPLSFDKTFPLNGNFQVNVGKMFDPIFGAEIESSAWFGSNDKQRAVTNRFDTMKGHNAIRGVTVGLNGLVNLTNLVCGFKEGRNAETSAKVGVGYGHIYVPSSSGKDKNDLTVTTKLAETFNLGKTHANAIRFEAGVDWSLYRTARGEMEFNKNNAQFTIGASFIHRLGTSNGTKNMKKYDVGYMRHRMNELSAENKALRERPATAQKTEVKVLKTIVEKTHFVTFSQGSFELTDAAKATLNEVANIAKEVELDGYASPEGNAETNATLSQNRVDAVANFLQGKGIKVTRKEAHGADGEASQRWVVITLK